MTTVNKNFLAVQALGRQYGVHRQVIPTHMRLSTIKQRLEDRVPKIQAAGLGWLLKKGLNCRLMKIPDTVDFERELEKTVSQVSGLLSNLSVFGVDGAEAQDMVAALMAIKTPPSAFFRNCSVAANLFKVCGLPEAEADKIKQSFLAIFQPGAGPGAGRSVNNDVIRPMVCATVKLGNAELIVNAFSGLKRTMMGANVTSADKLARIAAISEEDLYRRLQVLRGLSVGEVRIAPSSKAQKQLCMGSAGVLLARAEELITRYNFTETVFSVSPWVLETTLARIRPSHAAAVFLAAARELTRKGDLRAARNHIDRAKQIADTGNIPTRTADRVNEFHRALTLFQGARDLREKQQYIEAMRVLREAYGECLKVHEIGASRTRISEKENCVPIAERIKKDLAELYCVSYRQAAEAADERPGITRDQCVSLPVLEEARHLLNAFDMQVKAEINRLCLRVVDHITLLLADAEIPLAHFIFRVVEPDASVVVSAPERQALQDVGRKVVEEYCMAGQVDSGIRERQYYSSGREMRNAANLILMLEYVPSMKIPARHMRFAFRKNVFLAAREKVARECQDKMLKCLGRLAEEHDISFSPFETTVMRRFHVVPEVLRHALHKVNQEKTSANQFWGGFSLNLERPFSAELSAVCAKFELPPLLLLLTSPRSAGVLHQRMALLKRLNLIWFLRQGAGISWLSPQNGKDFKACAMDAVSRVRQARTILGKFGVDKQLRDPQILTMLCRRNLILPILGSLKQMADAFAAAGFDQDQKEEVRQQLLNWIESEGPLRGLSRAVVLKASREQRLKMAQRLKGVKGAAIRVVVANASKIALIIMQSEKEFSQHVESLEGIEIEVGGTSYSPFRAPRARLWLCEANSVSAILEKVQTLVEDYGFTQEALDVNPYLLDATLVLRPGYAALALVRTANYLIEKGRIDEAYAHAERALPLVAERKESSLVSRVKYYYAAFSLYRQAVGQTDPSRAIALGVKAEQACRGNSGSVVRERRPIWRMADELIGRKEREQNSPSRFILDILGLQNLFLVREAIVQGKDRNTDLEPLLTYLDEIMEGRRALAEGSFEFAVERFDRAVTFVQFSPKFNVLSKRERDSLRAMANLHRNVARGADLLADDNVEGAGVVFHGITSNRPIKLGDHIDSPDQPEGRGPAEIAAGVRDALLRELGIS